MAEGEVERQDKDFGAGIAGCGIGNLGHGLLKNGFKDMAPAELLLQSIVEKNGILRRKGEHGMATKEAVDGKGKSKETELRGADAGKQSGFSENQVHDLKALLRALTLISRNLPLPNPLLDEVHSISFPPNVLGRQNGCIADIQDSHDVTAAGSKDRACAQFAGFTTSSIEQRASDAEDEAENVRADEQQNGAECSDSIDDLENILQVQVSEGVAGGLLREFEDAVLFQQPRFMSAAVLSKEKDCRVQSQITYRIHELEGVMLRPCLNPACQ